MGTIEQQIDQELNENMTQFKDRYFKLKDIMSYVDCAIGDVFEISKFKLDVGIDDSIRSELIKFKDSIEKQMKENEDSLDPANAFILFMQSH